MHNKFIIKSCTGNGYLKAANGGTGVLWVEEQKDATKFATFDEAKAKTDGIEDFKPVIMMDGKSKTKKANYWQVVGWNAEGNAPEDEATVSSPYEDFAAARTAMIEFIFEDGLEECVDENVDLNDPDLQCITVNNGNRGYYLQNINVIVTK